MEVPLQKATVALTARGLIQTRCHMKPLGFCSWRKRPNRLELTPAQSRMLAQASVRGEITLALRSIADIGDGKNKAGKKNVETRSVKVLRYGVKSKAYGVN